MASEAFWSLLRGDQLEKPPDRPVQTYATPVTDAFREATKSLPQSQGEIVGKSSFPAEQTGISIEDTIWILNAGASVFVQPYPERDEYDEQRRTRDRRPVAPAV